MYFLSIGLRLLLALLFLFAGITRLAGGLTRIRKTLSGSRLRLWLVSPRIIALPAPEFGVPENFIFLKLRPPTRWEAEIRVATVVGKSSQGHNLAEMRKGRKPHGPKTPTLRAIFLRRSRDAFSRGC